MPVKKLEDLIREHEKSIGSNERVAKDGTPLAFGKAEVPPGDLARLKTSLPITHQMPAFQTPDPKNLLKLPSSDALISRPPWIAGIFVTPDLNFWGESASAGTIPRFRNEWSDW